MIKQCSTCAGTGWYGLEICTACRGAGRTGHADGECWAVDDPRWANLRAMSSEDREELLLKGWVSPHVSKIYECASGCSHCLICDEPCSADWGLYQ